MKLDPRANGVGMNAELDCSFGDGQSLAAKVKSHIGATVRPLLNGIRPDAVVGRIWAVVVNPLKGLPIGSGAHVFEERLKAIPPPFANRDAACAIVPVIRAVRIVAPAPHVGPSLHLGSIGHAMLSVFRPKHRGLSGSNATAAFGLTAPDVEPRHQPFHPASAAAKPLCPSAIKHSPVSECSVFHSDNISWTQYLNKGIKT